MMRSLAIVALLLSTAVPAAAQDHSAHGAKKPAKAKKICRVKEAETGTRLGGGKVCKTAEEWEVLDSRARNNARDLVGPASAR